jgi:chemotaxis regulatin CheY-phosphate phosphatase CheZ
VISSDVAWSITVGLSVLGALGGWIARDRQVMAAVAKKADAASVSGSIKDLHQRVEKFRDDYVRRDDLDKHLSSIERLLRSVQSEQHETNRRLDALIVRSSDLKGDPSR